MTAILAASVSVRTLADGTLRLAIDIEPRDAQAAFALFGKPGSPVALVRITDEAAVAKDRHQQAEPEKPAQPTERKPFSLASKVALTCGEQSFHRFLMQTQVARWSLWSGKARAMPGPTHNLSDIAAFVVRDLCRVASRSEITVGSSAADDWLALEADYHHWQRTGAAA